MRSKLYLNLVLFADSREPLSQPCLLKRASVSFLDYSWVTTLTKEAKRNILYEVTPHTFLASSPHTFSDLPFCFRSAGLFALFWGLIKYSPDSSPLHWLFPLVRTLFPLISTWLAQLRRHLHSEVFPITSYDTALPHTVHCLRFVVPTVPSTVRHHRCSSLYVQWVLPLCGRGFHEDKDIVWSADLSPASRMVPNTVPRYSGTLSSVNEYVLKEWDM